MLLAFTLNELGTVAFGITLSNWAAHKISQTNSLAVMACLTVFLLMSSSLKNIFYGKVLLGSSQRLHNKMLDRIIKSPVSFFDTNPLGRVLNRFANDVGVLDRFLPITALEVVDYGFYIFTALITIAVIAPLVLVPISDAAVGIILLFKYFFESIKQSRSYELVSRSPLYSLFSSTLSGIIIIRCFKQTDNFKKKFRDYLHKNTKGSVAFWSISRCFGFYLDLIYNMSAIASVFILAAKRKQNGDLSGLALIFILSVTGILQFALRQLVQVHVLMSSVARIKTYTELPIEAPLSMPEDSALKQSRWPQEGKISFEKVYMKYRSDLEFVIQDLALNAKAGEKIGCIGRTGAGKSSIIQILFRMIEIDQSTSYSKMGKVLIDEVDTKTIGLHVLRNSISIIPQAPFLFAGNIRTNLDPLGECTEEQLWQVLDDVNLKGYVENLEKGLNTEVSNSSPIFSVGQKQLVCLARAIIKRTKILVLDEATANVDQETDEFIQQKIREKFTDCTIFTIAHRLSTIANYDKVLVLDKGSKVEFDQPFKLLARNDTDEYITNLTGHFASMVLNTGRKSAGKIFNIAQEKYFSTVNKQ